MRSRSEGESDVSSFENLDSCKGGMAAILYQSQLEQAKLESRPESLSKRPSSSSMAISRLTKTATSSCFVSTSLVPSSEKSLAKIDLHRAVSCIA